MSRSATKSRQHTAHQSPPAAAEAGAVAAPVATVTPPTKMVAELTNGQMFAALSAVPGLPAAKGLGMDDATALIARGLDSLGYERVQELDEQLRTGELRGTATDAAGEAAYEARRQMWGMRDENRAASIAYQVTRAAAVDTTEDSAAMPARGLSAAESDLTQTSWCLGDDADEDGWDL